MRGTTKVNKDFTFKQSKWHFTVSIFICRKKKKKKKWMRNHFVSHEQKWLCILSQATELLNFQLWFIGSMFFCFFSKCSYSVWNRVQSCPTPRRGIESHVTRASKPFFSAVIGTLKQQRPWINTVHACAHAHTHPLHISCFSSSCKWDVYFCL